MRKEIEVGQTVTFGGMSKYLHLEVSTNRQPLSVCCSCINFKSIKMGRLVRQMERGQTLVKSFHLSKPVSSYVNLGGKFLSS